MLHTIYTIYTFSLLFLIVHFRDLSKCWRAEELLCLILLIYRKVATMEDTIFCRRNTVEAHCRLISPSDIWCFGQIPSYSNVITLIADN